MNKIDAFHLKVIAIIAMFLNHVGHTFENVWNPPLWEFTYLTIGLLTFPIMAYLLVEGFFYTRSRWKYAGRLFLFGLISLFPFHYLFEFNWSFFNPINNIMFTLMLGVLMMMACEKVKNHFLQILILIFFILASITSDWNLFGIPIIFGFYRNHGKPENTKWVLGIICLLMMYLTFPKEWTATAAVEWLSNLEILTVIPILAAYNGQRGYSSNWIKWGFYAFYPLHISLLLFIRILIFHY